MARKTLFYRIKQSRWLYAALVPTFAFLAVFMLYPAADAIRKSFFYWKMSNYKNPNFVGLENYTRLFQDGEFWRSFLNLLIFIVWGFLATFVIMMPITYLVYKLGETRTGKWFQRLYVIPMMVPAMVLTLYWKFFYEYNFGILNSLLRSVGLEQLTHVWLGEKQTAMPALLFQGFPWVGGFGFLILLAGFQGIEASLHESAEIDGANTFQQFLHIDIPLVVPQMKLLIILGMIGGLQQYAQQMIMTDGGPDGSTTVPGLVMYNTAFVYGDLGYGSALGVMLFVIILAITILSNKYIKSRES